MLFPPGFSCNQLAVLTQCSSDSQTPCYNCIPFLRILRTCSSGFIQNFLDHYVLMNVNLMVYMLGAYDVLFLLSFYLTDFKAWHYDVYCYDFFKNFFFKNSELFFRVYSGCSGLLCVDQCRFDAVNVRWSPIHCRHRLRLKCGQCVEAVSP